MSKPGRNDPCYCGSEKKYKNCHMADDKAAEQEKRQQEDAAKWLRQAFMKYARDERFAEPLAYALPFYWNNHYTIENAEEMSMNEALRFFDWFVFDYQHEGLERLIVVYHQEKFDDLSAPQQKVLDEWLHAPAATAYEFSSYEGQKLYTSEFVTRDEITIYEPSGHGRIEAGDLLLGRLVPVRDRLEFSAVAAYLPKDEIEDLAKKLELARVTDSALYPEATYEEFMRRNSYIIIHHALEQAEKKGRPPVAAEDPSQAGRLTRKAAKQIRKLPRLRR
jgi:hypothetical protein